MTRSDHFERLFLSGVENFNARRFWDAHECWEELWLEANSEMHRFLQGLIQLAAAYHHCQRGTLRGGARLFASAFDKLCVFPADYGGVLLGGTKEIARQHFATVSLIVEASDQSTSPFNPPISDQDYPLITLSQDWKEKVPENW